VSKIEQFTFPNGFRIVYEKSKNTLPIASIFIFCDVGSVYEDDSLRGVSHFIEHMCFKGTKKILHSKEIFKEFDKSGADYNASTYKRYTYYNLKCPNENIETYLLILSDMILNSTFVKKEFDKELKVVVEENIKDKDDLENDLDDYTDKLVYQGTAFENPIDIVEYHKKPYSHEKIVDFYRLFYQPNNIVLSIVSNISFSSIKTMIKKSFFYKKKSENMDILKNRKLALYLPPTLQTGSRYLIHKVKKSSVTYLSLSFRTCNQFSLDKYRLNLLQFLLGSLLSSRLFQLLREDNGLTYSSSIDTQYCEVLGDFTINAITDPDKLIKNGQELGVLPLIIQMMKDLIKHGITESELNLAKHFIRGRMKLNMEDNDNNAIYNGEQVIMYPQEESIVPYEKVYETYYKDITLKQIMDVIQKYFIKSNMNICILGEHVPSEKIIRRECEKL
jgi:predicted Zn-dependent peptidase